MNWKKIASMELEVKTIPNSPYFIVAYHAIFAKLNLLLSLH